MSPFQDPEILRSILESLPTGLCILDMQKKLVLWSAGAERITGYLRHEVLGHGCVGEPLLHCDQQDCEWCNEDCPLARAIKTAHPIEATALLRHRAGCEIPVRVCAVPVHNAHGSIIGAVETFAELHAATVEQREASLTVPGSVDELTGVASPALTRSYLRENLETLTEARVPCAVLCFRLEGLDHFRAACGPEAALALLRVVVHTLESSLWKTDFVGRWSDDQFLAILGSCREEALPWVGERIRRLLAGNGIEWWGEKRALPVSIGQATAQPGDTVESLMGRVQESLAAAAPERAQAAAAPQPNHSSGS
ncbi:MAG TPA: diguanylate cyclase [Candidatus Sulfotelmatobacter sp.]|nr:diguanylate cyclase [Candidatus Sulfotelmatobacter sp.]